MADIHGAIKLNDRFDKTIELHSGQARQKWNGQRMVNRLWQFQISSSRLVAGGLCTINAIFHILVNQINLYVKGTKKKGHRFTLYYNFFSHHNGLT